MKNIYLIGFMGTGKSSVAAYLSNQHHMDVVEMDQTLVERESCSIPEIFANKGEHYFRDAETRLLLEIGKVENKVVSCGGGVVLREENVIAMKESGTVVLLTAEPETILLRVKDDEDRPLLQGKKNVASIREMIENRRPKYEVAADLVIHTDGKEIDEIGEEIIKEIKEIGV